MFMVSQTSSRWLYPERRTQDKSIPIVEMSTRINALGIPDEVNGDWI